MTLTARETFIDAQWRYRLVDVSAALWSALQEHGKEYIGIERPKGFGRQWRAQDCFRNATLIAEKDSRATYFEDIAYDLGLSCGFHHAWITLDGEHAVDPTWSKPAVKYFGIAVPLKQLWQ